MKRKAVYKLMTGAALSAAMVWAQSTDATPPSPPSAAQLAAHEVSRMSQFLDLSSEQQKAATNIFTAERASETTARESMKNAHTALKAAIVKNDSAAINTSAVEIGNLTAQQVEAHAKAQATFYSQLTPEQQAKYQKMLSEGPGGPRGFGGPRGGGPGAD